MSWLLTVNKLAHEIEEKKSHELAKQRKSELSNLRGKLLMIFGDDAADIIENGQQDTENVAYRHTNFEFENVGGLCGSSIKMAFFVMVGGGEERIEYNNYVDSLEDASQAYIYLHDQAKKRIDRHYEMLNRKAKVVEEDGGAFTPELSTLQKHTLHTLRVIIRMVKLTGLNPVGEETDAIYAFAKNIVAVGLAFQSVDTDYDDLNDQHDDDED